MEIPTDLLVQSDELLGEPIWRRSVPPCEHLPHDRPVLWPDRAMPQQPFRRVRGAKQGESPR
jgi:hypothetical protein